MNLLSFLQKGFEMIHKKQKLKFGDRVLVKTGFYEGETAILTYLCPESGCFCGFIEGDGTEQLHYFYEEQLEVLERGFYFPSEDEEGEEALTQKNGEGFTPNLVPLR